MAARENQGLQIALIIFVMLTIVLIVTTYMFFSKFQEERDKGKATASDRDKQAKAATDARDESEALKSLIGSDAKDNKDAVKAKAAKDFETYGKSIPEANQNYRYLVEQLAGELKNANARIAEITLNETKLNDKVKSDEATHKQEIEKHTQAVATTSNDLVGELKKFESERAAVNKGKAELAQKWDASRKKFDELTKKSGAEVGKLTEEAAKLASRLQAIHEEEERTRKANEIPDGKIIKVDQRARKAWINRGTADGLRVQASFSVFDEGDANPLEGTRKAKIEVVRLVAPHMAEARIVEDDFSRPMLLGDPIFSPTWEPGRVEHFALAGKIDLDKDGKSDYQRVRDLIALNGGIIDEEVDDGNNKTGQMSINTKYLVLGEQPVLGDAEVNRGKGNNYAEIQAEALTLGVKTINVNQFLDYMGYKAEERTVNLGKSAQSRDFKARLPEGVQRVRPASPAKDPRKPASKSEKVTY